MLSLTFIYTPEFSHTWLNLSANLHWIFHTWLRYGHSGTHTQLSIIAHTHTHTLQSLFSITVSLCIHPLNSPPVQRNSPIQTSSHNTTNTFNLQTLCTNSSHLITKSQLFGRKKEDILSYRHRILVPETRMFGRKEDLLRQRHKIKSRFITDTWCD